MLDESERPSVLKPDDFGTFFQALWQQPPFAWQQELATRVLNGDGWPEAIALPTASGKTACMDIAVFALATQASQRPNDVPMSVPRRMFFAVDRRVIVDEAHERARRLAEKLRSASNGILKAVADNLRRVAHGQATGFHRAEPLAAHVLRGGMYRSESWARNPLQPTIVASTVDQVGSRLLFRAYGRGSGTWPIYAGLVANDSLILLDEAHCAQPFLQTLQAVKRYQGSNWARVPLKRSFQPVVMSATPPTNLTDVFRDASAEASDAKHPLGKRYLAKKPAVLAEPVGGCGNAELADVMANAALELVSGGRQAIVVFANRVATAREVFRRLAIKPQVDAMLLTGRMRPVDKDSATRRLKQLSLHSARSSDRILDRPAIVAATQTLEVGADLDFDGLVTECAGLDALRQRFGRLNRMGRDLECLAKIFIRGDQAKRSSAPDPVYGEALAKTWHWLKAVAKRGNGTVDFGVAKLDPLLPEGKNLLELSAPSTDAPTMLPAHIDCWAQTAPEPRPSPDVALFLRGLREGAPDVQVVWRADLDFSNERALEDAIESLTLCPPSSAEALPVPFSVMRRWMAGAEEAVDHGADVEGTGVDLAETGLQLQERSNSAEWRLIRWRGAKTTRNEVTSNPADVRPGDVIVIPTAHPGAFRHLGDLPSGTVEVPATLDVGDRAHRIARAKPILRLHSNLVGIWPDTMAGKTAALSLLDDVERKYEDDPEGITEAVAELLAQLSSDDAPQGWSWLVEAARELKSEFASAQQWQRECHLVGDQLILTGRHRIAELAQTVSGFSDEDDTAASGMSHRNGRPVLLRTHLPGVEDFARAHASGCALPKSLADAIALAGLLHDAGKADPRFQSLLRGGSPWVPGEPLAKSAQMKRSPAARRRAQQASGYPSGGRHELLSLRLAESVPGLLPENEDDRDLVLHLIASHHGYCRPLAPVVDDPQDVSVTFSLCGHDAHWSGPTGLERLDSGIADRYWRLTRRYGWWGLAWLEALLRLADWRRSEWEEAHDGEC